MIDEMIKIKKDLKDIGINQVDVEYETDYNVILIKTFHKGQGVMYHLNWDRVEDYELWIFRVKDSLSKLLCLKKKSEWSSSEESSTKDTKNNKTT